MTDIIIVRWDGTANTEWGRYLEAPDHPVRPAPPLRSTSPQTLTGRTLALLQDRALTRAEVAQELGVSLAQAAGAIKALVASRLVTCDRGEQPRGHFGPPPMAAIYRARNLERHL